MYKLFSTQPKNSPNIKKAEQSVHTAQAYIIGNSDVADATVKGTVWRNYRSHDRQTTEDLEDRRRDFEPVTVKFIAEHAANVAADQECGGDDFGLERRHIIGLLGKKHQNRQREDEHRQKDANQNRVVVDFLEVRTV